MINVAIIGAGIGAEHLSAYTALQERFSVKVLCDANPFRAEALVETLPHISVLADMRDAIARPDVDLIDVCLPPHLHLSASEAALAAGKHVVCEKPLGCSLAEVDRLVASSKAANRSVFPVFQYRYGLAAEQLNALVAAGLAGKAYTASIETHWNREEDYYATPWRGTWNGETGGAVLGHAIHNHDLLTCFLGPVSEVSGCVATRVNDIETEDCAAISFRMANGALATSSITLGAVTDTSRLRLCFEGFTAESGRAPYMPLEDAWCFTARNPNDQRAMDAVLADVRCAYPGYAGFFAAVADALDGRPGNEVTLEDGRHSIELVTAVYLAARTSRTVSLPLDAGTPLYAGWQPETTTCNGKG